ISPSLPPSRTGGVFIRAGGATAPQACKGYENLALCKIIVISRREPIEKMHKKIQSKLCLLEILR
ncbi:MAG: hypothetical protein K2O74_08770, partial [Eubacteriales bacterium]|nr:hypothetical protein [Eubacteriales bacterium]